MTDASQPRSARGKMLPAGILATAFIALLAFAPLASAASDPVGSGTTKVTLNGGWTKYLKTFGIKIQKQGSVKLKGKQVTFKNTGGSVDPTNGKGEVTLGGGLKFKAGKKTAKVNSLVLNTKKKALFAKVGGKKVKFASVAGWSQKRDGFGVDLTIKKLKLTNAAASQLNKKTGYSKGKPKPFLKNKLVGKGSSEVQPATVTVLPVGNMTFTAAPVLLQKLSNVKVTLQTLGLTQQTGTVFTGPILGGTISPTAAAGVVQSGIGLNLVQKLPTSPTTEIATTITLGGMYVDLAAKTATVEVVAVSNAESEGKKPLDLGNLGRSSIADIVLTGVNPDPTTRTVGINAAAVLQPISAEVLQGFVSVYKGYIEAATFQGTCQALPEECKEPAEQEIAKAKAKEAGDEAAKNQISAGEALGTFSFTAQTQ